jgi:hypothetical protein
MATLGVSNRVRIHHEEVCEGKAKLDIANYKLDTGDYFVQTFDPSYIPTVFKSQGVTYMVYKWNGPTMA